MPQNPILFITVFEWMHLTEDNCGVCLKCGVIKEGGIEPDREGAECESCGAHEVCGIEQALLLGRAEMVDEESDIDDPELYV